MLSNKSLDNKGFTLLETMIALAIMALSFSAILMVESGALDAAARTKQMNIVSMLAKNAMVDAEIEFQQKQFNEVRSEETGSFDAPFQEYSWKREVKELEFPTFSPGASEEGGTGSEETLTKLVSNFFSKSIRLVQVTVSWKVDSKINSYSVSTFWVDLNHDFSLNQ